MAASRCRLLCRCGGCGRWKLRLPLACRCPPGQVEVLARRQRQPSSELPLPFGPGRRLPRAWACGGLMSLAITLPCGTCGLRWAPVAPEGRATP